jgi:hypothetical protein
MATKNVKTKAAARALAKGSGYTVHHETSESGNHGHGSREYWARPGSAVNQYGRPLDMVTLSRVGSVWSVEIP